MLTIVVLLVSNFHGSNFSKGGGFFVHGAAIKSILIAIPSGGIVFALLGFEQAVQLGGGENPQRDLPRAVILSILIGAGIYILLQVAFIGALSPTFLHVHGPWTNLGSSNQNPAVVGLNAGPFYTVSKIAGLSWLAFLLRLDAVISPAGTGLIYTTSSARLSFALSRNGFVPTAFEKTDARTKVPVFGIIFAAVIGLLFLLPFPSWSALVGVVTSASVLMYAAAPLALAALRKQKPELDRVYRLPAAEFLAPLSFVCASWIIYWAGWETYTTLMVAMLIGYALIAASYAFNLNPKAQPMDWDAAWWIIPYLLGMLVISYFGDFGAGGIVGGIGFFRHVLDQGGNDDLGLWGGLLAVAVWSLIIYFVAITKRLPGEKVDEYGGRGLSAAGGGVGAPRFRCIGCPACVGRGSPLGPAGQGRIRGHSLRSRLPITSGPRAQIPGGAGGARAEARTAARVVQRSGSVGEQDPRLSHPGGRHRSRLGERVGERAQLVAGRRHPRELGSDPAGAAGRALASPVAGLAESRRRSIAGARARSARGRGARAPHSPQAECRRPARGRVGAGASAPSADRGGSVAWRGSGR